SGEDEEGAVDGRDRLALLGVQSGQIEHGGRSVMDDRVRGKGLRRPHRAFRGAASIAAGWWIPGGAAAGSGDQPAGGSSPGCSAFTTRRVRSSSTGSGSAKLRAVSHRARTISAAL